MDGLELSRRIRADRRLGALRLVMLTSIGIRGHAGESWKAGVAGYLTKPVRQSHLYDCLATVMSSAQDTSREAAHGAFARPAALVTRHTLKESKARRRRRILVADDNETNQLVAVRMLQSLGFHVDVAANGLEAVEAVHRIPYDAVLMDCQMPEMDGYAATRAIREAQPATGRKIPIIAMTAHAMQGDREKCLAAGMDDYLSKPVRTEDLRVVLQGWTAHAAEKKPARPPRAVPRPSRGPVLDTKVLAELRGSDGGAFLGMLIDKFLQEVPIRLASLREAVTRADPQGLEKAAHSLKGSSGVLGARAMSEICRSLEENGRSGSLGAAPDLLARLDLEFDQTRAALEAERKTRGRRRKTA